MRLSPGIMALLERYQGDGDHTALNALLQHAERVIHGVVRRHAPRQLPSHLDRDDLIAEGRKAAIRCASSYDATTGRPFESYVAVSVRNAIRDLLRSARTLRRAGPLDSSPAAQRQAMNTPDTAPTPAEAAEHSELRDIIATFPEQSRVILEGYYLEGLTDAELAQRLKTSRPAITAQRAAAFAILQGIYTADE